MGKITKTFVLGAAIGALAGLLLSPKTGKENQKMLKKKFNSIIDQVTKDVAKAKDLTEKQYVAFMEKASKLAEKAGATKEDLIDMKEHLMNRWESMQKTTKKKMRRA
ncbi:MAG: YtxH domain-containing protein [bacterium]|nr:YtxH domain-containing protein [bacterium]